MGNNVSEEPVAVFFRIDEFLSQKTVMLIPP
jgi:hypothetical protein